MKKKSFLIGNILIPIILGTLFYYVTSPDVIFVQRVDAVLGRSAAVCLWEKKNLLLQFIRNYGLDMLWAYALVFTLFFIIDNNSAGLLKVWMIAFFFSTGMEFLQRTSLVSGTFDFWDIIVEFLAETAAVFIIKNKFFRGGEREL